MKDKLFIKTAFFLIAFIVLFNPYTSLVSLTKELFYNDIIRLFAFLIVMYFLLSLFFKSFIYKLIGSFIILVSIELLLIALNAGTYTQSITKKDNELGWVWKTHSSKVNKRNGEDVIVRFNSLGLRGADVTDEKLLVLGSSIVQAQQLSENKIFTTLLNGINAGFDGYDTYQEVTRFNRDLYKLNIKHIILVVSPIDIIGNANSQAKIRSTLKVNRDIDQNIISDFTKKLRILNFSKNLFLPRKKENIAAKDQWYLNVSKHVVSKTVWLEWTNEVLKLKKHFKGDISIVLSPPRSLYNDKGSSKYWINHSLQSFCNKNNMKFLDLIQYLPKEKALFLDSVHYNEEGHKLVAKIIKEQILEKEHE